VVNEEKEKVVNITKQIEKQVEVLKAFYHTNDLIALIRVY